MIARRGSIWRERYAGGLKVLLHARGARPDDPGVHRRALPEEAHGWGGGPDDLAARVGAAAREGGVGEGRRAQAAALREDLAPARGRGGGLRPQLLAYARHHRPRGRGAHALDVVGALRRGGPPLLPPRGDPARRLGRREPGEARRTQGRRHGHARGVGVRAADGGGLPDREPLHALRARRRADGATCRPTWRRGPLPEATAQYVDMYRGSSALFVREVRARREP
jgi:hypothetical protein